MNNHFASDILIKLIQELNKENLKYAVLRNYEGLPSSNFSKDVDMLIEPKQSMKIIVLLKKIAESLDYDLVWKNKLDYLDGFVFMKIHGNSFHIIKLDLFKGLLWRGMYYLNADDILNNTIEYNNIKVPRPTDESLIMIMYYTLYAKKINIKYHHNIIFKASSDKACFQESCALLLSNKLMNSILFYIENNRINDIASLRKRIIYEVFKGNIRIDLIGSLTNHIWIELYNFKNPFKKILSFYRKKKFPQKNKITYDALTLIGIKPDSYSQLTKEFYRSLNRVL